MKKLTRKFGTHKAEFPPFHIYKGDLQQFIDLATSNGLNIKIADADYEYATLDEVRDNCGDFVPSLELTFYHQDRMYSLDLAIRERGIKLNSDNKPELIATWQPIKELLESRVPWYAKLLNAGRWFVGTLLGFLLLAIFISELPKNIQGAPATNSFLLGFIVLGSIMTAISFLYPKLWHGVYLQKEHEVVTFWRQYGEKIVLLVVGTILGVAAKVFTDHFFK